MKIPFVVLLTLALSLTACRQFIKLKYQTNRPFTFKNKTEYFSYLTKKEKFGKDHMVYLDSVSYPGILAELTIPFSVYYASFVNDSTIIKKSDLLMTNESCMGRMDGEIKKNIARKQFVDSLLVKTKFLKMFNLISSDNQPLIIDNTNKRLKVFLLYGFTQGTVYDYLYKEVNKTYASTGKSFDLYVISLDPVYRLPD